MAVAEEELADAAILHACGHSLFDERGEAYDTFGSYGRFGPDDYFFCGRNGKGLMGDIFDALFFNGQVRGLCCALSTATKEQLERRDAAGNCIFKSNYIFAVIAISACVAL